MSEIFRPNGVFTKFTVGTDRSSPLRIAGAQLQLDEERPAAESLLSISSASATNPSIVILPSQTSEYIFKVATTTSSANFSDITGL